jgi:S-adenosylmethionine:tRNA ribosyltransferase-isomerase
MASAGRPFTQRLLVELVARGVTVAPIVLHAGVSSPEAHEPPLPEWFEVGPDTARIVCSARRPDAGWWPSAPP